MDNVSLEVFSRDVLGKKVRALRRTGMIPLHLYGRGMPSEALQGNHAVVAKVVGQVGRHLPLFLQVTETGRQELVFIREIQRHPVTNTLLHVDFLRVDVTQKTAGDIPLILVGEAPAVRLHNGILNQTLHYLSVECLPMDMPERIEADISLLQELDDSLRISDLTVDPGITILADPDELVARVSQPRIEIEGEVKVDQEVGGTDQE